MSLWALGGRKNMGREFQGGLDFKDNLNQKI